MMQSSGAARSPSATARTTNRQQPGGSDRPSLNKVIHTLKCAIEKLQIAQGMEANKARQLTLDAYVGQVELLQSAFTALADAVLEEVDSLAAERAKAQREHAAARQSLQEMEGRVEAKLAQLARAEERLEAKLGPAGRLAREVDALAAQQAAGACGLEALRKDAKRLHLQVGHLEQQQAVALSEAAVAPLNVVQRSQVKDFAGEQVQLQVPGLIANSISSHVAPMIDEAVEHAARALRHDVAATTELLAADLGRANQEAAGLRADASALGGGLQQAQAELGALGPRVGRLEGLQTSNPPASQRLVAALEGKVDNLAAQQGRYAKSVEGVVAALVDDTVSLSKAAQSHGALAASTQAQLQDTKEALLRSATVFATVLKIPPPISSSLWSTTASHSPSRIAAGSLGGGGGGGGGCVATAAAAAAASAALQHSCGGSPVRKAADAAGGSPLRSKYTALLGALA